MPDIQFNFGTEDLESLKKLMNDILKAMEAIKKVVAESGNITTQHDAEAKKLQAQLLHFYAPVFLKRKKKRNRKQGKKKRFGDRLQEKLTERKRPKHGRRKKMELLRMLSRQSPIKTAN